MRVKLKVVKGASAGKVFEVKVPQFVIGRASGCQLRPQSDAISRQHCVIMLSDAGATIRDLKSRNGTIVNGEAISGEHQLATGDEIRVGPLHLAVTVTDKHGKPVKAIKNAAAAAAAGGDPSATQRIDAKDSISQPTKSSDSGIISDWLAEEEQQQQSSSISKLETRQFELDETDCIDIDPGEDGIEGEHDKKDKKKKKKEPGKLPKVQQDLGASSKEAAEKTLRKMFNRGL